MRWRILVTCMLFTVTAVSAYQVTVHSQSHRFDTGQGSYRYDVGDRTLVEDPEAVRDRVRSFDHDLRVAFWRDSAFHPKIFTDLSNYQPCGTFGERYCITLNEYGGFVRPPRGISEDLVGYGVYSRMHIEQGTLYPTGDQRLEVLRQNKAFFGLGQGLRAPGERVPLVPLYPDQQALNSYGRFR